MTCASPYVQMQLIKVAQFTGMSNVKVAMIDVHDVES